MSGIRDFQDSIRRLTHNADGKWRPDAPEKFVRLYCWLNYRLENGQPSVRHLAIFSVFIREIVLFQKKTKIFVDGQLFENVVHSFGDMAARVIEDARSNAYQEEMENNISTFLFVVLHYLGVSTLQIFPDSVRVFYECRHRVGMTEHGALQKRWKQLRWKKPSARGISYGGRHA